MAAEKWDEAREAELRGLWEKGLSSGLIAIEMGLTRNAVIGKLGRLGLKGRMPTRWVMPSERPKAVRARKKVVEKAITLAAWAERLNEVHDLSPPPEGGVSLMDRQAGQCCYPLGEPVHMMYCGAGVDEGQIYCRLHRMVMYIPRKAA